MQEVHRFNKVLKSFVLLGDIILLNLLLWAVSYTHLTLPTILLV